MKQTLRQIIVAIGPDWDNLEEVICCIDQIKWKPEDLLSAFDIIFKSFFTLDLGYPYESKVLYGVIQEYIYKIASKKVHANVNAVLSDIQSIPDNPEVEDEEERPTAPGERVGDPQITDPPNDPPDDDSDQ